MKLPPQSYPKIGLRPDLQEYLGKLLAYTISAWSETTLNHKVPPFKVMYLACSHGREAWLQLPGVNAKAWPSHRDDDRNLAMMRLVYEHSAMAAGCVQYEGHWRHHGRVWKRGERILNPHGIDCDYNLMENECRDFRSIDTKILNMMCELSWLGNQGEDKTRRVLHKWWKDGFRMDKLKDEPPPGNPAWHEIRRLESTPLVATP